MAALSFSKVDRLLELKRGATAYYFQRGLFEAKRVGRGWRIEEEDLPAVAEAINEYIEPPPMRNDDQLITPRQAAEILEIQISTVYNNINRGRLVAVRKPQSNRIWVTVSSVNHYLTTRVPMEIALRLPNIGKKRPVLGEGEV